MTEPAKTESPVLLVDCFFLLYINRNEEIERREDRFTVQDERVITETTNINHRNHEAQRYLPENVFTSGRFMAACRVWGLKQ
jgi:hypothetical protein